METFKFYTLGCKVNQYETQLMREQLLRAGLKETNSNTPADLYIVNTCTVTANADRESRRFIRHSIKENPNATIIAAGCYAEKDVDVIKAIDKNIIILPNKAKNNIAKYLEQLTVRHSEERSGCEERSDEANSEPVDCFAPSGLATGSAISKMGIASLISFARNDVFCYIAHFKDHTKAFVKIQDGCDNFCSYCKVPYVRGAPKSRDKDEIIQEAKSLLENEYKELVLTGICLGAYGKDLNPHTKDFGVGGKPPHQLLKNGKMSIGVGVNEAISLKDILLSIVELEGDFRIRLSSIEMQDVTEGLIDIIKNNSKICNHLHIPLQSGDDKILRKMNRKYSSVEFIKKVERVREKIKNVAITTDVMVGFPGETDEAFENTLKCIKLIEPMRTHIFTYSKRKGTAAFNLGPDVNKDKIKQRYTILKNLIDDLARSYIERSKSRPQRILVENTRDKKTRKLCGYTDTYIRLTFDGPDDWMDKFTLTRIFTNSC